MPHFPPHLDAHRADVLLTVGNAPTACECDHDEVNVGRCGADQPQFPRYFAGQLVEPDDLTAAEERAFTHEQLRARHTIGWGIARGFRVNIDGGEALDNAVLRVEAGFAIDRLGRDVYLAKNRSYKLQDLFDEREARIKKAMGDPWCTVPGCEPTPARHFCIAVRYKEVEARPVPSYAQQCGTPKTVCEYSRVTEDIEVRLFADDEFPQIAEEPSGRWCGDQRQSGDFIDAFLKMLAAPPALTDVGPAETNTGLGKSVADVKLKDFAQAVPGVELLHLARPAETCSAWPWVPLACLVLEGPYVRDLDCSVRRTLYSLQEVGELVVRLFSAVASRQPTAAGATLADFILLNFT